MDRLSELADRVESLTEADRSVDALTAPFAGLRVVDEGHPLGRGCYDADGQLRTLPAYTASLDAAMSLCPQPASFDLSHDHEIQGGQWQCLVGDAQGWTPDGRATAATPALALTAAALRARARTQEQSPHD